MLRTATGMNAHNSANSLKRYLGEHDASGAEPLQRVQLQNDNGCDNDGSNAQRSPRVQLQQLAESRFRSQGESKRARGQHNESAQHRSVCKRVQRVDRSVESTVTIAMLAVLKLVEARDGANDVDQCGERDALQQLHSTEHRLERIRGPRRPPPPNIRSTTTNTTRQCADVTNTDATAAATARNAHAEHGDAVAAAAGASVLAGAVKAKTEKNDRDSCCIFQG